MSFSLLFQALAAQKGISVEYCEGKAYLNGEYHAWTRYKNGSSYLYYDMTFHWTGISSCKHTTNFSVEGMVVAYK